jgi:hypothetical protein
MKRSPVAEEKNRGRRKMKILFVPLSSVAACKAVFLITV